MSSISMKVSSFLSKQMSHFPWHYDAYLLQNNTIDRNLRLLFQFGDIMLLERGSRKIK